VTGGVAAGQYLTISAAIPQVASVLRFHSQAQRLELAMLRWAWLAPSDASPVPLSGHELKAEPRPGWEPESMSALVSPDLDAEPSALIARERSARVSAQVAVVAPAKAQPDSALVQRQAASARPLAAAVSDFDRWACAMAILRSHP
jgi:hypothetical protein